MIKIRKKNLIYTIVVILVAFIFSLHFFKNEKIYCTGDLVAHRNNEVVKVNITYNLSNNLGNIDMVGELYRNNKITGTISRNVTFHYIKNDFNYRLTSESINTNSMDTLSNDILKEYMPDFFIQSNQKLSLNIKAIKSGGWMISTNSVPFLMCNKI